MLRQRVSGIGAWLRELRLGIDRPTDAHAFLPAALEVVETPPSPLAHITGRTIIVLVVVALLWAVIGTVDIIAIAPGRIVPSGRTKLVQPLESGVVRSIHVRDGQKVKAGEVLLEIDATINAAETKRLEQEKRQAALDVARLTAVGRAADGPLGAFLPPAGIETTEIAVARNLLESQAREIRARVAALDRHIEEREAGRRAIDATIGKLGSASRILERRQDRMQSSNDRLDVAQEISDQRREIEVQEQRVKEADGTVAALEEERRQVIAEFRRTVTAELSDAQRKVASLTEQLVQARQRTRLQTLVAPVDGTVEQLAVHTEGGVVTPAEVVLAVVPADSRIEIEAEIDNRDIGFVRDGQPAAIKVDTFNFTRYGLLEGRVVSVSQDAVIREGAGSAETDAQRKRPAKDSRRPQLSYTARIAPARTSMDIDGVLVPLSPGMAVTVEIRTGTRRVIEYLLSPLLRARQQAMRER